MAWHGWGSPVGLGIALVAGRRYRGRTDAVRGVRARCWEDAVRAQVLSLASTSPNSFQVSPSKRASWTDWMG